MSAPKKMISNSTMQSPSKFVFFGTPYVARDTLAALIEAGYVPALVITAPDAPKGRGMVLTLCETKVFALEHGLPVLTPEKLTPEVREEIASVGAEYALVVAYGKILPLSLIESFPKGVLNVHYSLLPKYRGASPVEAAIRAGETETGVSIQKMVKELDAGDVLASRTVAIGETETTPELRARLIREGAELLVEILPAFLGGELTGVAQDESKATHCGKIEKSEGELDLAKDALSNWRTYRALAESPGTYFFMDRDGKKIRVKIKSATFDGTHFTPLRVVPEGKSETDYAVLTSRT